MRRVPESAASQALSPGPEGATHQGDAERAAAGPPGGAGAAPVAGGERLRRGRGGRGGAGGGRAAEAAAAASGAPGCGGGGVGEGGGGGGGTPGAGALSEDHQRFPLLQVIAAGGLSAGLGACPGRSVPRSVPGPRRNPRPAKGSAPTALWGTGTAALVSVRSEAEKKESNLKIVPCGPSGAGVL